MRRRPPFLGRALPSFSVLSCWWSTTCLGERISAGVVRSGDGVLFQWVERGVSWLVGWELDVLLDVNRSSTLNGHDFSGRRGSGLTCGRAVRSTPLYLRSMYCSWIQLSILFTIFKTFCNYNNQSGTIVALYRGLNPKGPFPWAYYGLLIHEVYFLDEPLTSSPTTNILPLNSTHT